MVKTTSLETMAAVFSLEKSESTLKNLLERDIIQDDNENYNILKNILMELQYLKERLSNE